MTGAQVREARRLLGWSVTTLAKRCKLPDITLRIFETTDRMPQSMFNRTNPVDRNATVRTVLEAAGVEFIGGEEPEVRLRKMER